MSGKTKKTNEKLKVISLGGLGEIGKNITVLEYGDDIIIIDCGIGFPDSEMPGVDLVVPDITYLEENSDKIRGLFLTHGHEDHIGAIPYILRSIDPKIYGTDLTLGIIRNKLEEHALDIEPDLCRVRPGDVIKAGCFSVEFIRVNHSIPDACCLAIKTPLGYVVHSGDFKLDLTPVESEMMDITRLGEIGKKGVLLLLCESTNVEQPGYTLSESRVGESLDNIFLRNKDKRIVIATFSSNVHRVQQVINASVSFGRKVAILGRSMQNIIGAAIELGYMKIPDNTLIDVNEVKRFKPDQVTLVTTGSQGEPMSALYRMTFSEQNKVELGPNDLVVISAHPIPGNEKLVNKIVNELLRRGIGVFRDSTVEVHVSGHACQEELKLMHALTKPKYFIPVHGETRHLAMHRELALQMGMPEKNVLVSDVGKVVEIDKRSIRFNGTVQSGIVLVDGYGVGDVGNIVLRDRKHLSMDGLLVVVATVDADNMQLVSGPDVVSRGFVYVKEAEDLLEGARQVAEDVILKCLDNGVIDWTQIKNRVKDGVNRFILEQTNRKPMILPIIMNV